MADFIADSLVQLDSQLEFNLLRPPEGKSKVQLAFKEACKIKKVVSYLRYLWRATGTSRNNTVNELKALLQKKPPRVDAPPPALMDLEREPSTSEDPLYCAVLEAMGLDPHDAGAIGDLNVEGAAFQQVAPAPKPPAYLDEVLHVVGESGMKAPNPLAPKRLAKEAREAKKGAPPKKKMKTKKKVNGETQNTSHYYYSSSSSSS